ncbi:MAG: phosphotransferase [Chloroflexi bacterium]|nr:phosphotransferase [Chloroflexota bacterium]MBP8055386.1 phosphotransferase [Chloroflexota bacterium]
MINLRNPWTQSGWHEQANAWIQQELTRQALYITGDIEQPHIRPWSTVRRIPTQEGDVYFKAVNLDLRHEITVTQALVEWFPNIMPQVFAFNAAQGWLLMPDGGTRFREVNRAEHDISRWERILPLYAETQIALAERVPELLALGVPDCRPTNLLPALEPILADTTALMIDEAEGMTRAEYEQLQATRPRIQHISEQLASSPVPSSLHHGDLHDANIFLNDEHPTFFDWGDCSVAHPFFSLRTVFVNIEYIFDLPEGAPAFTRLREAYLEPWTRFAPSHRLEQIYHLSRQLAPLCGVLRWYQAITHLPPEERREYAAAVPALLQEFLDLSQP